MERKPIFNWNRTNNITYSNGFNNTKDKPLHLKQIHFIETSIYTTFN